MAAKQGAGEKDFLFQAAFLACNARVGTLATAQAGQPYASLVTPALLPDGAPLLLLSSLAMHTRHLRADAACCLLLAGTAKDENPQTTPRLSLASRAVPVEDPAAAEAFLRVHPYAALYAGFTDFSYWRLEVAEANYIGGFAAACQLDVGALQDEIIRQLNSALSH